MAGRTRTPRHFHLHATETYNAHIEGYQLRRDLKTNFQGEEAHTGALYLTEDDLNRFWNKYSDVQTVIIGICRIRYPNVQHPDLDQRFRDLRRIACALISVHDKLLCTLLPDLIVELYGPITDGKLPLDRAQIQEHFRHHGRDYGQLFYEGFYEQQTSVLRPITIGGLRGFRQLQIREARLPIVGALPLYDGQDNRHAGFAAVKVRRSCCTPPIFPPVSRVNHEADVEDVNNVEDIAYAVLPVSGESVYTLVDKMNRIKNLPEETCIVELIDVIHRDDRLHFFVPYTPLYDLESMLLDREGALPHEPFSEIFKGLEGIAGASAYLFEELPHVEVDVTPQDILRYPHQDSPVFGIWKLANFRFDSKHENSGPDRTPLPSARNLVPQAVVQYLDHGTVSHQSNHAYHGTVVHDYGSAVFGNVYNYHFYHDNNKDKRASVSHRPVAHNAFLSDPARLKATRYRPPETESVIDDFSPQASSVWSLGCVLLELIAWIQGHNHSSFSAGPPSGVGCLGKLRSILRQGQNHDKFYSISSASGSQFSCNLQEDIGSWIADLSEYTDYAPAMSLAQQVLILQPSNRLCMRKVKNLLVDLVRPPSDPTTIADSRPTSALTENPTTRALIPPTASIDLPVKSREVKSIDLTPYKEGRQKWQLVIAPSHVLLCNLRMPEDCCVRHVNIDATRPGTGRFQLLENHDWRHLEVAGRWGAVVGDCHQKTPHVCSRSFIFDIQGCRQYQITDTKNDGQPLRRVVPASTGLIAFCYDRRVSLQSINSYMRADLPASQKEFDILSVAFSQDGKRFFVNIENGREHLLDIWDVDTVEQPYCAKTLRVDFLGPPRDLSRFTLLPCLDSSACVVFQDKSFLLITPEERRTITHAQSISFGGRLFGTHTCLSAATNEHYLAFVETNRRVKLYDLRASPSHDTNSSPKLIASGHLPDQQKNWRWLLVNIKHCAVDGLLTIEILICCSKREECWYRAYVSEGTGEELKWKTDPLTKQKEESMPSHKRLGQSLFRRKLVQG